MAGAAADGALGTALFSASTFVRPAARRRSGTLSSRSGRELRLNSWRGLPFRRGVGRGANWTESELRPLSRSACSDDGRRTWGRQGHTAAR